jgi:DNA-binding transcriptional LysR family regulator
MLARFATDHPAVRVEMRLDDRYVDLVEHEIDVAIRIGRLTDPNLVTRRLGDCQLILCASLGFIVRHGMPRTQADLASLPRLAFRQSVSIGDWTFIAPDGSVHLVDGRVAVSANNVQLLAAVAARDGGLVYGPDFVFTQALASGALVRVMADWGTPRLDVHAVFPALRQIPHKVRLFVDYLVQHLTDR